MSTLTATSTPDEVRAEWIKELRSGERTQGTEVLRSRKFVGDGTEQEEAVSYCCLGVLCDLAASAGIGVWNPEDFGEFDTEPDLPETQRDDVFGRSTTELPRAVAQWANVDESGFLEGQAHPMSGQYGLIGLNDSAGFTFEQIADVIESGAVREYIA